MLLWPAVIIVVLTDQDHWCFQLRFGGPSAPQPFYRPEVCALRPVLLDDTGRRGTTESQQDIVMYVVCVYIYIHNPDGVGRYIVYIWDIHASTVVFPAWCCSRPWGHQPRWWCLLRNQGVAPSWECNQFITLQPPFAGAECLVSRFLGQEWRLTWVFMRFHAFCLRIAGDIKGYLKASFNVELFRVI